MPDYPTMYKTLFNSVTKAITILQEAQQATEEIYISSDEPNLTVLDMKKQLDSNDFDDDKE